MSFFDSFFLLVGPLSLTLPVLMVDFEMDMTLSWALLAVSESSGGRCSF